MGVVGPNGCGKSNVIDAVRWVLGETSAKQLRGENMQDVIFAGSSERKPVSRASVELIFDNSFGRAAGAWSKFAEISVKRVIEREGASSYYINNQHVRRRDVADIFLGTGLGGRGYAIIEQGMISRIIEAKPDDMRAFLEEAAGVSKYKERRRETELRLQDTRENLSRVEDIRGELDKQLQKLERQAEQAEKFITAEKESKLTEQCVWFYGQKLAEKQRIDVQKELNETEREIEKTVSVIREAEAHIENLKVSREDASDEVNNIQGKLYKVNTEVARIEQKIEHIRETANRTNQQLLNIDESYQKQRLELKNYERLFWDSRRSLLDAQDRYNEINNSLEELKAKSPEIERIYEETKSNVEEKTSKLGELNSLLNINKAHYTHSSELIARLRRQEEKLKDERDQLTPPNDKQLIDMDATLAKINESLTKHSKKLLAQEDEVAKLEKTREFARVALEKSQKNVSDLSAKREALLDLQTRVSKSDELDRWLESLGLVNNARLWEMIEVEPEWEDAVESVLRERLISINTHDLSKISFDDANSPPTKVSFFDEQALRPIPTNEQQRSRHRLLSSVVKSKNPDVTELVRRWLSCALITENATDALEMSTNPDNIYLCVTKRGDLYYDGGIVFFAPDSEMHGVLARQKEIEKLDVLVKQAIHSNDQLRGEHQAIIASLSTVRAALSLARKDYSERKEELHVRRVEYLRLSDLNQRTAERLAQIDEELLEIVNQRTAEVVKETAALAEIGKCETEIREVIGLFEEAKSELEKILVSRAALNAELEETDNLSKEMVFERKSLTIRINDLGLNIKQIYQNFLSFDRQRLILRSQIAERTENDEEASLSMQLTERSKIEVELKASREKVSGWDEQINSKEQEKSKANHYINPLRDTLTRLNLNEQEYRIERDNYVQQLANSDANTEDLSAKMSSEFDVIKSKHRIQELSKRIESLGAVNMAALEELDESKVRKQYLDSQAEDLLEAVNTLESAIRSIDSETRERLSNTFEAVNNKFSDMFPKLFGGGEAKLVLTGDEILDAGLEVIARPPGKRNTTIHLLSGGEKALTALSLVFSLFQLNPAPFCLLDEVDAPLDDSNTTRYCDLVRQMSETTQFVFITHNKITMELAEQLVGVTMQEQGVSRVVAVDIEEALKLNQEAA